MLADLIDRLLPDGRLLKTNAHPLVEITMMNQGSRTLVHFVNLAGHSQTGYFPPIPMQGIQVDIAGRFRRARALKKPEGLPLTFSNARTHFILPMLTDYEVVVLGIRDSNGQALFPGDSLCDGASGTLHQWNEQVLAVGLRLHLFWLGDVSRRSTTRLGPSPPDIDAIPSMIANGK